ncbi:MAG: hypothetical protein WBD10_12690 [Acidobacteriaceae bacterium]
MKTQLLKCGFIAALCCATSAALAQNPFAGTWKVDYAKSHLTGDTMTLSPETNGDIHISSDNMSYSAKTDGSATTNPMGDIEHWTKVDNNDWKVVTNEGPVTVTEIYKVTDNGKSLTDTVTGTKPNGDPINASSTYARTAPGKGIYGKWRSTKVSNNSPNTAVIDANGPNGIIWHIPEIKATVKLNFDGKEVAPEGPTVPHGLMLAATKSGPRSFKLTEKMNGKLLFTGHYTVSADGKTMTEIGRVPGAAASTKLVYNKA